MRSNDDHMEWFKHWVHVSLSGPVTCNKRACRSVSESENIRVFFETAKLAYHGNYRKALRTINKCRAACNLATISELPSPHFRGNNHVPYGTTVKNPPMEETDGYVEHHGFDAPKFETVVYGTQIHIPSGLHIPGYPRSDSPLSDLPDDDQIMLEHPEDDPLTRGRGRPPKLRTLSAAPARLREKRTVRLHLRRKTSSYRDPSPPQTQTRDVRRAMPNLSLENSKTSIERNKERQGASHQAEQRLEKMPKKSRVPRTWPKGQRRQEELEAPSRKRTNQSHAAGPVPASNLDCTDVEPPLKKRRTCQLSFLKIPAIAMIPAPQGPSEPEAFRNIDATQAVSNNIKGLPGKALDNALTPPPGDPLTIVPRSSNSYISESPCTADLMDSETAIVTRTMGHALTISLQSSRSSILESPSTPELVNSDTILVARRTPRGDRSPTRTHSSILGSPSTPELVGSGATRVASLPPRIPSELDYAGDSIFHGSTMESTNGLISPPMVHSENSLCHSSLVLNTSGSALESHRTASSRCGSSSSSEDMDDGDALESCMRGNGYTPGALPPSSNHPSLTLEYHTIICDKINNEPSWRQGYDQLSPQDDARPPGSADPHIWSRTQEPQLSIEQPPPLVLPDFPPEPPRATMVYNAVHKPHLPVAPPVWAETRQELCESLNYFRSYQGGVYSQKKRARGYLLDGHPAVQDLWHAGGRCIISHGGGSSAINKQTKQTALVDDQTVRSASCNALINSWMAGQPIVLIAGNGYQLFPYNLEDRSYVVLGYYVITHAWEEPEPSSESPRGYFVRWKFMFQWIHSQGRPWWIRPDLQLDDSPDSDTDRISPRDCQTCHKPSRAIYNFGWVCTHSDCSSFFRRVDSAPASLGLSGYHPDFVTPRKDARELHGRAFQIRPKLPVQPMESGGKERHQITTFRHFWKGWWCDNCGRLSCREHWTHWECNTCHRIFKVKSIIQQPRTRLFLAGRAMIQILPTAGIRREARKLCNGSDRTMRCQSFRLPRNRGTIHLVQADERAQSIANSVWHKYQVDARQPGFFRRYSMRNHKLKGRMLSHYFSQNSGEPYEYVGGTNNTVPLDTYPSVRQALETIRGHASLVLGEDPAFNEVLSAAYMAEQKMEFHSDGEKNLGPTIASLSLGATATMRFRPIPSKWRPEESSDGILRKSPPVVLSLTLQHGDVLIMEGADIQEYYQHAVHPWGFRIAATARYIHCQQDLSAQR
ncbi:hypothetical protein JB92DRAFT_2817986 [Gautieria morchelliformis]|nr:hypothetical protein JB92DRAFT_2817986 [Gautieria morchelliformis]